MVSKKFRRLSGVICLVLLSLLRFSPSCAEEKNSRLIRWIHPIACSKEFPKDCAPELKALHDVLNIPEPTWSGHDGNPVCCFWVEMDGWSPFPGDEGYIIVVKSGGAKLSATNQKQLRSAIKHLEAVRVVKESRTYIPEGLYTNYPIVSKP